MKKNKSKLKGQSANKKQKKELELTLTAKIQEVIAQFGKVKKSEKAIERFSKKMIKKLSIEIKKDVTPVAEEKAPQTETKAKVTKPAVDKKPKAEVEAK